MKKKVIITLASLAAVGAAVAGYQHYTNSRVFTTAVSANEVTL